jgi:hypothetical protein
MLREETSSTENSNTRHKKKQPSTKWNGLFNVNAAMSAGYPFLTPKIFLSFFTDIKSGDIVVVGRLKPLN